MKKLPLDLTGFEVVHLMGAIPNGYTNRDVQEELSQTRELIVNLGSVFNELADPTGVKDGPVPLWVNEQQVWTMRAFVKPLTVGLDGKTNIGFNLLNKLIDLLAKFWDDPDRLIGEELGNAYGGPGSDASGDTGLIA